MSDPLSPPLYCLACTQRQPNTGRVPWAQAERTSREQQELSFWSEEQEKGSLGSEREDIFIYFSPSPPSPAPGSLAVVAVTMAMAVPATQVCKILRERTQEHGRILVVPRSLLSPRQRQSYNKKCMDGQAGN